MNLSNRDKMLLLILIGIVLFLVSDLVISKSYNAKTAALQTQVDTLTPKLTQLQGYNKNLKTYKDGIDKLGSSITSELSKLPQDVRSEDIVMYVTRLETDVKLKADEIEISEPQLVSRFNLPKKTVDGFEMVPSAALRVDFTLKCGLTYDQLKKLITYVYKTPEMTTLNKIEVSYNSESAGLTGSVVLEKYFVVSEDYVYSKTIIPPVDKGNENLFGTFSVNTPTNASGNTN